MAKPSSTDPRPLDKDGVPVDGVPDARGFIFNRRGNTSSAKIVNRVAAKAVEGTSLAERERRALAARAAADDTSKERQEQREDAQHKPSVREKIAQPIVERVREIEEAREVFDVSEPQDVSGSEEAEDSDEGDATYRETIGAEEAIGRIVAARDRLQAERSVDEALEHQAPVWSGARQSHVLGDRMTISHPITGAEVEMALTTIDWNDYDGEFNLIYTRVADADN
jgi:hypothetical protein